MASEIVDRLEDDVRCYDGGLCRRNLVCEDAADEIARLSRELDAARERERGYREALRSVEWSGRDRDGQGVCPRCEADALSGHAPDCIVGDALASTPPDTESDDA